MEEDLKKLLEENLQINKENNAMLKSIRRHFLWQRIFAIFYFILIVGPIIFGFIYLPSLLGPYISQYKELLGLPADGGVDLNSIMKNINPDTLKNVKQ
jgi:hypothetical protein